MWPRVRSKHFRWRSEAHKKLQIPESRANTRHLCGEDFLMQLIIGF